MRLGWRKVPKEKEFFLFFEKFYLEFIEKKKKEKNKTDLMYKKFEGKVTLKVCLHLFFHLILLKNNLTGFLGL